MSEETALANTRTQSLIQLADTLTGLFDLLDQAESEEERVAIAAEIERVVAMELADKTDAIAWFDRHTDAQIDLLKGESEDIARMIASWQRRKARIREITRLAMQRLGITLLKGRVHTISLRDGSDSVELTGEPVPPEYCTLVPAQLRPDKASIKRAIKSGAVVTGAELRTGEPTIVIR